MNFSKRKSNFSILSVFAAELGVAALIVAALPGLTNSIARASGAGLEVEVPFEIKASEGARPRRAVLSAGQPRHDGGVGSGGRSLLGHVRGQGDARSRTRRRSRTRPESQLVRRDSGRMRAAFSSSPRVGGIKGTVRGRTYRQIGRVSTFAKLPDAAATDMPRPGIRRGESPFAGKLYAAASGNASIYAIDSSGKASVFGTYNKPVPFELTTIYISTLVRFESGGHDADRDACEGRFCGEGRPHRDGRRRRQDEGRRLPGRIHPPVGLRVVAVHLRLIQRRIADRGHAANSHPRTTTSETARSIRVEKGISRVRSPRA